MTVVHLFPGQGSQFKGMGAGLFERFPHLVAEADAVLGYSIRRLCLEDPDRKLGNTAYTQPALYIVNALSYHARLEETGRAPDFAAGHSLGEYDALLAAEAFDFATGLRLVQKRGELMAAIHGGGMHAVVGPEKETISGLIEETGLTSIDIANLNTPTQSVLAGPVEDLERLEPLLTAAGARVVPLNVRTAFHSRYMKPVKEAFASFLKGFRFQPLLVPVVANFTALPYRDDEIAHNLAQQIDHSVRWVETIQYLLQEEDARFEELGPGSILMRMVEEIRKRPLPVNIARRY